MKLYEPFAAAVKENLWKLAVSAEISAFDVQ